MEEIVGSKWHYWVTSKARLDYPEHGVDLFQCNQDLALIHRAFGGDPGKRISNTFVRKSENSRNWLQKLAGTGDSWALPYVDHEFVRLPETLAVFPDTDLNRRLYRWLAVLAVFIKTPSVDTLVANQQATRALLAAYPGFRNDYHDLTNAIIQLRPVPKSPENIMLERTICQALQQPGSVSEKVDLDNAYPIWMWIYPTPVQAVKQAGDKQDIDSQGQNKNTGKDQRQKSYQAEQVEDPDGRSGLMAFRMESLFSWIDFVPVDRTEDDQSDVNQDVADDLDKLSISPNSTGAKRVRMDLDIVTADKTDIIVEPTEVMLPEWDYRTKVLKQNYCCLKNFELAVSAGIELPNHLYNPAQKLRRQFESLVPQKKRLKRQTEGDEIDLDAWLDCISDPQQQGKDALFEQYRRTHRDISCLLLADLSLSTDAWVSDAGRVIDIVKDSIFLFAEALSGSGDRFALCGFSSKKRTLINWHAIKTFDQTFNDLVRSKIASIEPGFYTRMGAAIRHSTTLLEQEQSTNKILLLLTDGKPNDLDRYEGRYGIEDTRHALLEARQKGIIPYCVTIDQYAREYLPYIFGKGAYTLVQNPAQLPSRLPGLYAQLTQM